MRIAYLANARIPSDAANAVQTIQMCTAFVENGHEVQLTCRLGDPPSPWRYFGVPPAFEFVPLAPLGPRGLRTALFVLESSGRARAWQPDLFFGRDVFALSACVGARRPIILEVHRTMRGKVGEQSALRWLAAQREFLRLVVVSEGMRRAYLEDFPDIAPNRVVVHPGAARRSSAVGVLAPLWPRRPGVLRLGYFGHLYEGRGVEVIAEAAARCAGIELHIVGGDAESLARWRHQGTSPNVSFHGHVAPARVPSLLQDVDVLLAPYQRRVYVAGGSETSSVMSPLKIFEYLSAEKPMICSDLPALREVLDEGVCRFASPDDVDSWVGAIEALRDPVERARLGAAAGERFRERHTWKARAARVLADVDERHP